MATNATAMRALLAPRSLALVGASDKPGSLGRTLYEMAVGSGYSGRLYAVNPRLETMDGEPAYADLVSLPEPVEHVVLALSNERLEDALEQAIDQGAKAATIFSTCILEGEDSPSLMERLSHRAKAAGLALCGGNCMGFYNLDDPLRVCLFASPFDMPAGGIAYIAQSGSAFGALAHNDRRLRFNLCVSSGNELATDVADYMHYALECPTTRVIGLFLETVRDPENFVAALEKASRRDIPVVILKVGRTALSAAMAATHTGALAGNHGAYQALFRRYGVISVSNLDELASTLILFERGKRAAMGGLASVHDSGGEREMIVDLASDIDLPFAAINETTKARIGEVLEPGLLAENPLDIWGSGKDYENVVTTAVEALLEDPDCALAMLSFDLRDGHPLHAIYSRVAKAITKRYDKPFIFSNNFSSLSNLESIKRLCDDGVTILDGSKESLIAIAKLFAYRDYRQKLSAQARMPKRRPLSRQDSLPVLPDGPIGEFEALSFLKRFGIDVSKQRLCSDWQDLQTAIEELTYPVVLKTAERGIDHKTDQCGVHLALTSKEALQAAYQDLKARLGPRVLLAEMTPAGIEVALGAITDSDFGPMISVSAGGTAIEILDDKAFALAPVDHDEALQLIEGLRLGQLLVRPRNGQRLALDRLLDAIVALSHLASDLKATISEIDINPIIVGSERAVAVDALILLDDQDRRPNRLD